MSKRLAVSKEFANEFLEHLNFALGEPTATGLNTLVAINPEPINTKKLAMGIQMAMDEEEHYLRQKQKDPNYRRQLHGWRNDLGNTPIPTNPVEYERAYELAKSLSSEDLAKLIGGYGGKRGNKPTGEKGIELAADALYNASYGIDTLTGAPLNYKQNAGHLLDFAKHGQGPTRPEQDRVNKVFQEYDGIDKIIMGEDTLDAIGTAELYAKNPAAMIKLLSELPSSRRETKGWEPELKAMRKNANRWHMNQENGIQGSDIHLYNGEININGKKKK